MATAPQLREALHGVIAQGQATVVLDLLGVTFLDSTALGVLVGGLKRCRELGGELHVVVADARIRKIFEITGLEQGLPDRRHAGRGGCAMIDDSEFAVSRPLGDGDRVVLTFPARGDLVVLARLVASAISTRVGFDIEELEDLRLAVGELCLLALQGSDARHGDLRLEFTVSAEALDISCTLGRRRAGHGRAPTPRGRGRRAERADSGGAGGRARPGARGRIRAGLVAQAEEGAFGVTGRGTTLPLPPTK